MINESLHKCCNPVALVRAMTPWSHGVVMDTEAVALAASCCCSTHASFFRNEKTETDGPSRMICTPGMTPFDEQKKKNPAQSFNRVSD